MGELLASPNANMAPQRFAEFIAPLSVFSCSVGVIERNGVVKKEMKEKKMGEFLILLPLSLVLLPSFFPFSLGFFTPIYFVSLPIHPFPPRVAFSPVGMVAGVVALGLIQDEGHVRVARPVAAARCPSLSS